jgi:hypothetical protein
MKEKHNLPVKFIVDYSHIIINTHVHTICRSIANLAVVGGLVIPLKQHTRTVVTHAHNCDSQ